LYIIETSENLSIDPSAQETTWADTTLILRHFITLACLPLVAHRDGKVHKEMEAAAVAFRDTKVGKGYKVHREMEVVAAFREIRVGKDHKVRKETKVGKGFKESKVYKVIKAGKELLVSKDHKETRDGKGYRVRRT
jgi:hypothetical protein